MQYNVFPEFTVPAIGQGGGGNDSIDDAHRIKVFQYGFDCGMTLIDTAEAYQNGHSEEVVGKAIAGRREKIFISTKFSADHHAYDAVKRSLEGSLRRLGTDYIDCYQVHWPNPTVPLEETMRALSDAKREGKIRHIGVSNFSRAAFDTAERSCHFSIASNQIEYNLYERGAESDFLPFSEIKHVMVMAYNPLLLGIKGKEFLNNLGEKYNKTPSQIILNWLASHNTVVPIPRTSSIDHTRENAESADFILEEKDKNGIDETFKNPVHLIPTWKIKVIFSDKEQVYCTLEEAKENRFRLAPSPEQLAEDIKNNAILKPIRLRECAFLDSQYEYELLQGRIRYWAWIIAYGPEKPIPAYIND